MTLILAYLKPYLSYLAIGGAIIAAVSGFYIYAQHRQAVFDDAKYQAVIQQQEIINAKKEGEANAKINDIASQYADDVDAINIMPEASTSGSMPQTPSNPAKCGNFTEAQRQGLFRIIDEKTALVHACYGIIKEDRKEFAQ